MNIAKSIDWFIHSVYFNDETALRQARLFVKACFLTSIFSISYVGLSVVFSYERGIYFTAFNVIGYFVLPFLLRLSIPLWLLGNVYTSIGAITVLVLTWYSGGMWSAIYPWIIAIPVLALLVVGKQSAIYWSVFSFLCMTGFGILELRGVSLPVQYDESMRVIWFLCIIPGLLLIIMVVSFTFEHSMQRALKDVELKKYTIEEQSAELEKLIEAKDDIIRILAHDLRTPFANINVLSKMVDKKVDDDETKELIEMISKASSNAEMLVKDVLEMAALEHGAGAKLKTIFCEQAVQEVVQSFSQVCEAKDIAIKTNGFTSELKVTADVTYLRSVLENLISNAIKFSQPGSEVLLTALTNKGQLQLRIRDFGPGVPKNEEDKLFKKFSRLSIKPTAGESSSGLGLSLVKQYMELMNGDVWFERPEGKGSIFAVTFKKV